MVWVGEHSGCEHPGSISVPANSPRPPGTSVECRALIRIQDIRFSICSEGLAIWPWHLLGAGDTVTMQCSPRWPEISAGAWLLGLQRDLWPPVMTQSASPTLMLLCRGGLGRPLGTRRLRAAPAPSQTLSSPSSFECRGPQPGSLSTLISSILVPRPSVLWGHLPGVVLRNIPGNKRKKAKEGKTRQVWGWGVLSVTHTGPRAHWHCSGAQPVLTRRNQSLRGARHSHCVDEAQAGK